MRSEVGSRRRAVESWLRDRVLTAAEGDLVPSEAELAERFGVSRMTARQAVQALAAEGLVRRRRGAGTFVAPRPLHRQFGPLMSFTDDMRRRGRIASSRILSAELRMATEPEREALHLPDSQQRVVSVERVRLADGVPMAVERAILAPDCAAILSSDLESGSMHEALTALGRPPVSAMCRISARTGTAAERRLLDLPPHAAVLQEQRVIADQRGDALEFTTTVYAPERYVIDASFSLAVRAPRG